MTLVLEQDLHLTESQKVTVVLSTPEVQEITGLDMIMAERINEIAAQYADFAKDFERTVQKEPEVTPCQVPIIEKLEDSQMQEVQRPDTSQQ